MDDGIENILEHILRFGQCSSPTRLQWIRKHRSETVRTLDILRGDLARLKEEELNQPMSTALPRLQDNKESLSSKMPTSNMDEKQKQSDCLQSYENNLVKGFTEESAGPGASSPKDYYRPPSPRSPNRDEDRDHESDVDLGAPAEPGNLNDFKDRPFSLPSQATSSDEDSPELSARRLKNSGSWFRSNTDDAGIHDCRESCDRKIVPHVSSVENSRKRILRSIANDTPESANTGNSFHATMANPSKRFRRFIADDTPESAPSRKKTEQGGSDNAILSHELIDTQDSNQTCLRDIVCAICHSGESPEDDPIYLCDGPGRGIQCKLAVHSSCYSVNIPDDPEKEWRCDPCAHRFEGGSDTLNCIVCGSKQGPLKKLPIGKWVHTFCTITTSVAPSCRTQAIRYQSTEMKKKAKRLARANKIRSKRSGHGGGFLDDEASIAPDDDTEGGDEEETNLRQIEEEEECNSSFINDSSQLGYSQDVLDRVDPENEADINVHRRLDQERYHANRFTTPLLNRRMQSRSQRLSDISTDVSDSGLGDMRFIRSVLEHHRQGGTAEEIERLCEELEGGT